MNLDGILENESTSQLVHVNNTVCVFLYILTSGVHTVTCVFVFACKLHL